MRLLTTRNQHQSCPLCREQIQRLSNVACSGCETRYHRACWQEFAGCATLGCRSATFRLELEVPAAPRSRMRRLGGLVGLGWVALRARWVAVAERLGFEGPIEDKAGLALTLGLLGSILLVSLGYLVTAGGTQGMIGMTFAIGLFLLFPYLGNALYKKFFRGD